MERIIPQNNSEHKKTTPSWFKPEEIIAVGKEQADARNKFLDKIATEGPKVILSYACSGCNKTHTASNPALIKQETIAKRAGKEVVELSCPDCGSPLIPYNMTTGVRNHIDNKYANQIEKKTDLKSEASGTTNTIVDRHLAYKALQAMEDYASNKGFSLARVSYIDGAHSKHAGQQYPMLNDINCKIEWIYGQRQKGTVYASIKIDPAGKFKYPLVLKTANGTEYPFEKETVEMLEKEADVLSLREVKQKKSDTPNIRKPDITRFQAVTASMGKEADAQFGQTPQNGQTPQFQTNQQVVNPGDGKTYQVKQVDPSKGIVVTDPTTGKDSIVPHDQSQNLKPAVNTDPAQQNTTQVAASLSAEAMANNLVDKFLNKTTNGGKLPDGSGFFTAEVETEGVDNDIIEEIDSRESSLKKKAKMNSNSVYSYIDDASLEASKELAARGHLISSVQIGTELENDYTKEPTKFVNMVVGSTNNDQLIAYAVNKFLNKEVSNNMQKNASHVATMSQSWQDIRREMKTQSQMKPKEEVPIEKLSREAIAKKALGFDPEDNSPTDSGRHPVSGVPVGEKGEIEVGMTEFPFGEKRTKGEGKGYEIPFHEMDKNQVKTREHFVNQDKLPERTMRRDEVHIYMNDDLPDRNYGQSVERQGKDDDNQYEEVSKDINKNNLESSAVKKAMGIFKQSGDIIVDNTVNLMQKLAEDALGEGVEETPTGPVQFKSIKTAPKIDEYTEPEVIEPASGKAKEAITKFKKIEAEIKTLEDNLKAKLKPFQDSIKELQTPANADIAKKKESLKSYLDMMFEQLSQTSEHVASYSSQMYAAVEREVSNTMTPTVAQLIKKAEEVSPEIVAEITKIKELMENDSVAKFIERFLYEFPVSKVQEKKISALNEEDSLLHQLRSIIRGLIDINEKLEDVPTII